MPSGSSSNDEAQCWREEAPKGQQERFLTADQACNMQGACPERHGLLSGGLSFEVLWATAGVLPVLFPRCISLNAAIDAAGELPQ